GTGHPGSCSRRDGTTTRGYGCLEGQGNRIGSTILSCPAPDAYHLQGRGEDGLPVVAEALALVDKNDERWWEAELHRLKGELLLLQGVPEAPQAEACLHYALMVAHRQKA